MISVKNNIQFIYAPRELSVSFLLTIIYDIFTARSVRNTLTWSHSRQFTRSNFNPEINQINLELLIAGIEKKLIIICLWCEKRHHQSGEFPWENFRSDDKSSSGKSIGTCHSLTRQRFVMSSPILEGWRYVIAFSWPAVCFEEIDLEQAMPAILPPPVTRLRVRSSLS